MSETCEYANYRPIFLPDCAGKVVYVVRDYFSKVIPPRTDRHLHLCEAHAQAYRAMHPFAKVERVREARP